MSPATAADADEIEFDELEDQPDITRILYYGNEGTAKTTNLATMANLGPVAYVAAEAGLKKRALQRHKINTSNIKVFPPQGVELTFDGLENLFWRMKSDLDDNPDAWVGVVWDSVTEIVTKLVRNQAEEKAGRMTRAGQEVDRFFIDRDYYGVMSEQVRLLLRRFRDLPIHMGIAALMRRDQDDDGAVTYGPAVTPALQNDLMGFVDLVCLCEVVQFAGVDEYRGTFKPKDSKYRGKERFAGAVPKQLIDPTFTRVHEYATEQLELKDDPIMVAARKRRDEARERAAEKGDKAQRGEED